MMIKYFYGTAVLFLMLRASAFAGASPVDVSLLREGDIIFHESVSRQCRAVKLATRSRYTHAGIIITYDGRFMVLEAVQPVKITPLESFIRRGVDGHFVVKRLKNRDRVLDAGTVGKMKRLGTSWLGKNYDLYFEWDDRRLYCTELIWKLYKRAAGVEVGKLRKLREFDLSHPHVKQLMAERYGPRVPLDEPVISPQGMFEAENLATVLER